MGCKYMYLERCLNGVEHVERVAVNTRSVRCEGGGTVANCQCECTHKPRDKGSPGKARKDEEKMVREEVCVRGYSNPQECAWGCHVRYVGDWVW